MTRQEFLGYIIRDGLRRTDKDLEIYEALDDTLYDITTEDFPFQSTSTSETIALTGVGIYDFPITYSTIINDIKYVDSTGQGIILNKISKQQFDIDYSDYNETQFQPAEPIDYMIYGDKIYLAPFETSVTTEKIIIYGTEIATKLTENDDEPQFADRWRELIKRGVLWRIWNGLGDTVKSDRNFQLYQRDLEKLKRIDTTKSNAVEMVAYSGF
ncbi:MAG: hypothetical protein KKC50_08210 [Candidatus Omnitrophica bacterium]|nr:hypothetical protein [Candidatus Omnitrophota bacterium]